MTDKELNELPWIAAIFIGIIFLFLAVIEGFEWVLNYSAHPFPDNIVAGFYYYVGQLFLAPYYLGVMIYEFFDTKRNLGIVLGLIVAVILYTGLAISVKSLFRSKYLKYFLGIFFTPAIISITTWITAWILADS